MWGVKLYRNRTMVKQVADDMFNGTIHGNEFNFDQKLLTRSIWPMAQFDSVILRFSNQSSKLPIFFFSKFLNLYFYF